jgi:lactoylglutathione lyase
MKRPSRAAHNVEEVVPFLWVRSMKRSLRYYVDGLGFRVAKRWTVDRAIRWCRLELGGAALMLQELAKGGRRTGKLGQGMSLCFNCKDALALYEGFKSRRLSASEPEVGNAMWYTTLSDPDGYRIQFESATDVAEDTKLSAVRARSAKRRRPPRTARRPRVA